MTRYSGIQFTVANPDDLDQRFFQDLLEDETKRSELGITYLVIQTERTELIHYQGMIQFNTPKTHSWIRRHVTRGIYHFEQIKNARNLSRYCKKELTRVTDLEQCVRGEVGEIRMREYDHVTDYILTRTEAPPTERQVMERWPKTYLVHHSGIKKMVGMTQADRDFEPNVLIYYGATGTGKSWMAMQGDCYKIPTPVPGGWWWYNYQHEERVVMDEFRHDIKFAKMLTFLDRYKFTVAIKGMNATMNSKTIVITTNIPPNQWYPNVRDKTPLYRRFKDYCKIYEFKHPTAWDNPMHNKTIGDLDLTRMVYNEATGFMDSVTELLRTQPVDVDLSFPDNQLGLVDAEDRLSDGNISDDYESILDM